LDDFPSSLIDYYCVSHNLKYLSESEKYEALEKPLIYPRHRFNGSERAIVNKELDNLNYGIEIHTGKFEVNNNYAIVPYDLTIAYALAAAVAGDANKINLIGFEGYSSGDDRQKEMIELFSFLQKFDSPIRALTPTTYPITQGSIYEPKFEI
jgi:4-hydroxy 2-oxovalerate aldolase